MKTICFFGASVTQQKNGYAVFLSNKLNQEKIETHIFGYGGNHINDAGICFLNKVVEKNPDYCFIDFFTTGYIDSGKDIIDYLDTIVYNFTKVKCKLIFLFLLRIDIDHIKKIEFYNFLKKYLEQKNLYYIDINDYLNYSTEFCRDDVHTTDLGSEIYSAIIYNKFKKNLDTIKLPINIEKTCFYNEIKILTLNKIFTNNFNLSGKCFIIAFNLIIGPKSGFIEINEKKYLIWDIYCHYERQSFNLKNIELNGNIEIKILQDHIDYSEVRRKIEESNINKELNIIEIYYIGENLNII